VARAVPGSVARGGGRPPSERDDHPPRGDRSRLIDLTRHPSRAGVAAPALGGITSGLTQIAALASAGVTGRPDELRGQVISASVVLRQGRGASDGLREELVQTARRELGPLAVIGEVNFVDMLPKTRSGKIVRAC